MSIYTQSNDEKGSGSPIVSPYEAPLLFHKKNINQMSTTQPELKLLILDLANIHQGKTAIESL